MKLALRLGKKAKVVVGAGILVFELMPWASAQTSVPQVQNDSTMKAVAQAYELLGTQIAQLMNAKEQELAALRRHATDLDAYLRACGDAPGCTQPITTVGAK